VDVENMTINRIRWVKRERGIRGAKVDKKDMTKSKENDMGDERKGKLKTGTT
jgi:hypothetical protein